MICDRPTFHWEHFSNKINLFWVENIQEKNHYIYFDSDWACSYAEKIGDAEVLEVHAESSNLPQDQPRRHTASV